MQRVLPRAAWVDEAAVLAVAAVAAKKCPGQWAAFEIWEAAPFYCGFDHWRQSEREKNFAAWWASLPPDPPTSVFGGLDFSATHPDS